MEKPYIIGITGGSGSGKTKFLKALLEGFSREEVTPVFQDDYYRKREHQLVDENGEYNFDHPDSIDHEYFARDLKKLSEYQTIEKQEYTYNNPNKTSRMIVCRPAPVILVEGIFIFHYQKIAELLDLKIFIDAMDHVKLKRRLIRDREERGYGAEDVLYKYENHIMPSYQKYIAPHKAYADLVVPNNTGFSAALEVIETFVRSKTSRK